MPGVDFEGKVVVVTGAAGGIGGALVRELLQRGARTVVAADVDARGVGALSEELGTAVPARWVVVVVAIGLPPARVALAQEAVLD